MTDKDTFFAEIDELASEYDEQAVKDALSVIDKMIINRFDVDHQVGLYRRKGEYLYTLSNYETDKDIRIAMLEAAFDSARKGHELNMNDFECCKVLCSTSGRLAEESSLKKRINYGFMFKNYLDKAISITDNDYETLHMRGRFCYTVASLSMIERMAAKMIGQIPNVSYSDALADLIKAEGIIPGVAENQLFIGKTYLAMGDLKNAKLWLSIASKNKTDVAVEQEHVDSARELLADKRLKSV